MPQLRADIDDEAARATADYDSSIVRDGLAKEQRGGGAAAAADYDSTIVNEALEKERRGGAVAAAYDALPQKLAGAEGDAGAATAAAEADYSSSIVREGLEKERRGGYAQLELRDDDDDR